MVRVSIWNALGKAIWPFAALFLFGCGDSEQGFYRVIVPDELHDQAHSSEVFVIRMRSDEILSECDAGALSIRVNNSILYATVCDAGQFNLYAENNFRIEPLSREQFCLVYDLWYSADGRYEGQNLEFCA